MEKRDKLPYLDPNVRGIFDRIIAAAVNERKRLKSEEYRQAELRHKIATQHMREAREQEAMKAEMDRISAERQAEIKKIPTLISFQPSGEPLKLRESVLPRFVR